MKTNYLDELNESQRAAVLYNEGPALVIAGAGSGKTRVLTYKIAYLLEQGLEPWSILALTFTNKAAREMKHRVGQKVGEELAKYIWMGTFHSVFSRILRMESALLGYPSNFTIYDSADSKSLIKTLLKEMNLSDKEYKPGSVQRHISHAKNMLVTPEMYEQSASIREADKNAKMPLIHAIYKKYNERCKQSGAMDFDDLLLNTYLLFKQHPDVCARYAEQFKYILVDEYQDTNHAQHCIVLQLSSAHQRVCVVGDDAQSIYSFRGANIDNILKFSKLFDNTRLFKLEQNYRSTQNIVNAANSLIAKNRGQIPKEVFSENAEGEPLRILTSVTATEESENVVNLIAKMKKDERGTYDDFAILYRTNAQSRVFEEVLRRKEIPYVIYGGLSFYQRKEIKDVIAYFRMAVNPNDEEAFKRIINTPGRGIGDATISKVRASATMNSISMWEVLSPDYISTLDINKGTLNKLLTFREIIEGMIDKAKEKNAAEAATYIVGRSQVMNEYITSNAPEDISRRENIYELVNGVELFCTNRLEEGDTNILLSDYLSEVSLLAEQEDNKDEDTPRVTLMTIHSAKGLEFRHVFVVGLEENLFPSPQCTFSLRELEEERRLFYVAVTRAEESCFLSYAKCRQLYGRLEYNPPSRFLKDIDARFLTIGNQHKLEQSITERAKSFKTPDFTARLKPVQTTLPAAEETFAPPTASLSLSSELNEGTRICHERFGNGTVIRVEGSGNDMKATVAFDEAGQKQLLLKYARFTII